MLMHLSNLALLAMAAPRGGEGQPAQASWISTLLPLAVIFAIFYFLMIRPQQKQQKRHREMLSALQRGDRVITRGGILGTIHGIAENVITLEIADNVRIKINRDAIAGVQQNASSGT
jgi:preprotein translocase subunit YajC